MSVKPLGACAGLEILATNKICSVFFGLFNILCYSWADFGNLYFPLLCPFFKVSHHTWHSPVIVKVST